MGRPRKWADEAERKRHERSGGAGPPVDRSAESAEGLRADATPPGSPLGPRTWVITEDEYIAHEVEATRAAIAWGLKDHDGQRLRRAGAYARWRYRSWLAGETTSP